VRPLWILSPNRKNLVLGRTLTSKARRASIPA
jgi:hypothetical protein